MTALRAAIAVLVVMIGMVSAAHATTLWVGNDTATPVEMFTPAGVSLGFFGQGGATGSALDGAGHVYTVAPAFGNNVIKKYDAAENEVGTIIAAVSGNFIEDMTYGGGGTLWVSTFEGNVFHIDATGAALSSFNTASSFTGVTTDGSFLYTTNGFFGDDSIIKRQFDGTVVDVIHTGFAGGAGIGFDETDGTFWVGYLSGPVRQFSATGALLGGFTAGGHHDGLEVGEIGGAAVPEPTTVLLLGAGLVALAGARVARRRKS
jgi:hypothetical protein